MDWYPPVGVFIGVLALVAALVPLFRDLTKIGKGERAFWTLVMFALVILELRVIYHDRDKHDQEQAEAREAQLEGFARIGDGIKQSVAQSDSNFNTTVGKTNTIIEDTNTLLKNITGGESYPYALPQVAVSPFPLIVWDKGNYPLTGVTIKIGRMNDPIPKWGNDLSEPISLGTIAPHEFSPVPKYRITPRVDQASHEDQYWIWISAQNGTVYEDLSFRQSKKSANAWAYRVRVDRHPRTANGGYGDVILMSRGWSDEPPTSPPERP